MPLNVSSWARFSSYYSSLSSRVLHISPSLFPSLSPHFFSLPSPQSPPLHLPLPLFPPLPFLLPLASLTHGIQSYMHINVHSAFYMHILACIYNESMISKVHKTPHETCWIDRREKKNLIKPELSTGFREVWKYLWTLLRYAVHYF